MAMRFSPSRFARAYDIDPNIGCLAQCADTLPEPFDEWVEVGSNLPQLLRSGGVRKEVSRLTERSLERLLEPEEARLLFRIATFFGAACVWGSEPPATSIPRPVSSVLVDLSDCLGMQPLLSYAPFIPWNWKLVNPSGEFVPDNIAIQQKFIGTIDERWFIAVHVAIEAGSARLFIAIVELHHARVHGDTGRMEELFRECEQILKNLNTILLRMPEHCEPGRYFQELWPYIQGFHTHPVVYEGFWDGLPQRFWGESGSQSAIIPALDCAFGIPHSSDDQFALYLREMPKYMPWAHRRYLADLNTLTEQGDESLFVYALGTQGSDPGLCEAFYRCVMLVADFRRTHLGYARDYIFGQGDKATETNQATVGTGGTHFLKYLQKHLDDTLDYAGELLPIAA